MSSELLPPIPYAKSEAIQGIRWLTDKIYSGYSGDTWSCTWANDDNIYTLADDSNGSNLAIDVIAGNPPFDHKKIERVNPMSEWGPAGANGWWKGSGLASIDGVLYLGIYSQSRPRPGGATKISYCAFNSAIMKSEDYGLSWTPRPNDGPALFPLFPGREFPTPYFVQYSQDYTGAIDDYVYLVSNDGGWNNWNCLKMARVPRERFSRLDVAHWEFFVRADENGGHALWTPCVGEAGAIYTHKGYTGMTGIQYVPAVKRFILGQWSFIAVKDQFDRTELCPEAWPWPIDDPRYHTHDETMLCLYESEHPWGPWRAFHVQPDWGPSFYSPSFPAKWFEADGKRLWIVEAGNYRGEPRGYEFVVQQLELIL